MKHRLAYRMALTYGLVFILAVAVIDAALVFVYRENQLKKNENYYLSLCNVLASMAENNIKITDYIDLGGGMPGQGSGRVLLLDTVGNVLLDSGGAMTGVHVTNREFRSAAESGKPAAGYYTYAGKGMVMFSHPVVLAGKVSAVVMISVYIQDIYDDINRFMLQVILISVFVATAVALASFWTGRRLSRPIAGLTSAAEKIYKENVFTRVDSGRNDEIGMLADTFNRMGSELQKVEAGRKRFISDVSHELKTPLASIKALVEALLADESDRTETTEYLEDIDHEIDRLSGLVSSLLTSARLEEVTLKKEPLNLSEEADYVLRAMVPLAGKKRILFENACSRDVVIKADRSMLREVLINLVDNAVKYGKEDGWVKVEANDHSFRVIDNGYGIPQEELPNIFDSFYRVDKSRSGEGGSGIGLYIVKRIVELHGFRITGTSKLLEGSTFSVIFEDVNKY